MNPPLIVADTGAVPAYAPIAPIQTDGPADGADPQGRP